MFGSSSTQTSKYKRCSTLNKLKSVLFKRNVELCRPIEELVGLINCAVDPYSFLEPSDDFIWKYPVTNYHLQLILHNHLLGDAAFRVETLEQVRHARWAIIEATQKSERSMRLHQALSAIFAEREQGFFDEILVEGTVHF